MAITDPTALTPGTWVRYTPSAGGPSFLGRTSNVPWALGDGHNVVHLVDMEPAYAKATGRLKTHTTVKAASLSSIEIATSLNSRRDLLIKDIATAINRHSIENDSDTPDHVLAEYAVMALDAFAATSRRREKWYGKGLRCGDRVVNLNLD